jgi:hypothetical protein
MRAQEPARAAAVVTTVGIDVVTTGNTATSLGTIERCVRVDVEASPVTFDVDVFLDGVLPVDSTPNVEDLTGYTYFFTYPTSGAAMTVTAKDHLLLINAAVGSTPSDALSNTVPDSDGSYKTVVADFGTAESAEANPPYTQGLLAHYTLQIAASPTAGVYELGLGTVKVKNSQLPAKEQFDPSGDGWGVGLDDDADDSVDEDIILDNAVQYGLVAVNQDCPAPPTPTPTPTSTPTSTPTPTPTSTPGPAVGGIAELPDVGESPRSSAFPYIPLAGAVAALTALAAGAWYARSRRHR